MEILQYVKMIQTSILHFFVWVTASLHMLQ